MRKFILIFAMIIFILQFNSVSEANENYDYTYGDSGGLMETVTYTYEGLSPSLLFDNNLATGLGINPFNNPKTSKIILTNLVNVNYVKFTGQKIYVSFADSNSIVVGSYNLDGTNVNQISQTVDWRKVKYIYIAGYSNVYGSLAELEMWSNDLEPIVLTSTASVNKINLSWNSVNTAQEYRIYKNGILEATVGSNNLSYTLSGLVNNTEYSIRVVAFRMPAASSETTINVRTLNYFSAAPSSNGVDVTASSVNVKWEPVQDTELYEIKLGETGVVNQTTNTKYMFNDLNYDTAYTAYVRQKNLAGIYSDWTAINFRTLPPPEIPPDKPDSITVLSKGIDYIEIEVSSTQFATGYKFYINNRQVSTQTDRVYRFTGLQPRTSYSLSVKSYNEYGESRFATGLIVVTNDRMYPTVTTASSKFVQGNPTKQEIKWTSQNVTQGFKILVDGNVVGTYPASNTSAIIDFAQLGLSQGDHNVEIVPLDPEARSYRFQTMGRTTGSQDMDRITGEILDGKNVIYEAGKYVTYIVLAVAILFIVISFIFNKFRLNLATADHAQLESNPDTDLKTSSGIAKPGKIEKEVVKSANQDEQSYYKIKAETGGDKVKKFLADILGAGKKQKKYKMKVNGKTKLVDKQMFYNTKHQDFKNLKTKSDFEEWQRRFNDYGSGSYNKFHNKLNGSQRQKPMTKYNKSNGGL